MTITPSSGSSRTPDSENRYKRRTRDDRNSGTRSPRPVRGGSRCRLGASCAPPPSPFDPLHSLVARPNAPVCVAVDNASNPSLRNGPLAVWAWTARDVHRGALEEITKPDLARPFDRIHLAMNRASAMPPLHEAPNIQTVRLTGRGTVITLAYNPVPDGDDGAVLYVAGGPRRPVFGQAEETLLK